MKKNVKTMPAGMFKAKCLNIMNQVNEQKITIIITKRGVPVAQLKPVEPESKPKLFGYLKGSVDIKEDIISPIDEAWEANE